MGEPAPALANTQRNVESAPLQRKTAATIRYPFWFGGSAASMAAVVTHPLDLGICPPRTSQCGSVLTASYSQSPPTNSPSQRPQNNAHDIYLHPPQSRPLRPVC